jgi:DNA-binding transcriptional regulator LsrR (DeoR family)
MAPPEKFSSSQKAEIALARFEPLKRGGAPRPYSELIAEFGQSGNDADEEVSVKTIQKAIRDAFHEGLVTLEKAEAVIDYDRDPALERALCDRFSLKTAIVVVPKSRLESTTLHVHLGHAMATEIHNNAKYIFRHSGDIIGLGSGRGPHYTVQALTRFQKKFEIDSISLISLTGSLFPQMATHLDFELDADTHTAFFGKYFRGSVDTRPIVYPIAHEPHEKKAVIQKTWLSTKNFPKHIPHHAIVGVGVLSHHRASQELRKLLPAQRPPEMLEPIFEILKELVIVSDSIMKHNHDYCPVGDLCNRFFLIPPPKHLKAHHKVAIQERLMPLIDQINERLLTITKTQLGQVANVMLVAGTKDKARAIHYLLTLSICRINMLCVDQDTAGIILRL